MPYTISEHTDAARAAEYLTESAPRTVTATGKISAYGIACGYIYRVTADHDDDTFAMLTTSPGGDGFFVDYFDNLNGRRVKAYRHFERKTAAERCHDRLARTIREQGNVSQDDLRVKDFNVTVHTN